jgi:uncharacterized protein (DUF58 family)
MLLADMNAPFATFFRTRWQRWLDRRIPPVREVTLNQRRIFIFLSKQGGMAGLVLVALFVGGINYANNLLLGLCFFLGAFFVIVIHHTYANLSGLRIAAVVARPAFVGEDAAFVLRLDDARGREHESLLIEWEGRELPVEWVHGVMEVTVPLPARKRGWFRPSRLRLSSLYPVGFIRTWTWLDMDLTAIVYPHPEPSEFMPVGEGSEGKGESRQIRGNDDFQGLKTFSAGDPLAHVSWKHLARGQGMLTKLYTAEASGSDVLDWNALQGVPIETRLSRLTWWVLMLSQQGRTYGLRLPGQELPLGNGIEHRDACLKTLALFGREHR